ncbi:MAG: aspartate ammonia-lyase [Desulfovibrionaceae bacterium]
MRTEHDALGARQVPDDAYWGIHTLRASENFPISGRRWPGVFLSAFGQVKLACLEANAELGALDQAKAAALARACGEMVDGRLHEHVIVDPFQGGAGTSTNMCVNEVLANRAIEILGGRLGDYEMVHPIHDVNKHQSTNDVFPTALKAACLRLLKDLEGELARLQEALQAKEQEFADVVSLGRTQLMDAVPVTLGMSFGSMSEAASRDRWRIFKCRERLKQVNLGGTAVGTGLGAPRTFIFLASQNLKRITGLPLSRAENLADATRNMDCFAEAAGMLQALGANLLKLCSDLRLMASGPDAGLGEIELPPVQAGSSIMAGKINPVLPEALSQVALRMMAAGQSVALAAGLGQLELNQFAPFIAHEMLESLGLCSNALGPFTDKCVKGITARRERCEAHVKASMALATVLVPVLGYEAVEALAAEARRRGVGVAQIALERGVADEATLAELLSPRRMRKLGFTDEDYAGVRKP